MGNRRGKEEEAREARKEVNIPSPTKEGGAKWLDFTRSLQCFGIWLREGLNLRTYQKELLLRQGIDPQLNRRSEGLWLLATSCRRVADQLRAFQLEMWLYYAQ